VNGLTVENTHFYTLMVLFWAQWVDQASVGTQESEAVSKQSDSLGCILVVFLLSACKIGTLLNSNGSSSDKHLPCIGMINATEGAKKA
jgi:hypothetical protein